MTAPNIDAIIAKALRAVPEQFRERLANLAIIVEDSDERAEREGSVNIEIAGGACEDLCNLLGVYEGVPASDYGGDRAGMLPDTITLFRDAILVEAEDTNVSIEEVVRHTIWHEIAHYFGFDEDGARALERKWEDRWEDG